MWQGMGMTEVTHTATRYSCLYQGTVRCGGDQSKRAKCKYCHSTMFVQRGLWGVYTWRGDGRYLQADAHRTFVRLSAADRFASANDYVTRWIPSE